MDKLIEARKIWPNKSDEWLYERLAIELTQKVEEIHRLLKESAMCEANSNAVLGEVRAVLKAWDNYWELYNRDSYTGKEFEIVSSGLDNAISKLRKVSERFT